MKKKIAIFASGFGSNAENIFEYFKDSDKVNVATLVCNNPNAGVIERFIDTDVEVILIEKKDLSDSEFIQDLNGIDLIVLAGFLALIPIPLIAAFPKKIVNIHPALLPKYGGKGMYGDHVHRAVLDNNEKEHGITIHYVNEEFDKGEIIFQEKFEVEQDDDLKSIQSKIHTLEFKNYPIVIEKLIQSYI
jgi:phosphoribosylglycinamide formyltransferase-1